MGNQSDNDWKNLGEDMRNTVQNAINSGDYSKLSGDMSRIAGEALGTLGERVKQAGNMGTGYRKPNNGGAGADYKEIHQPGNTGYQNRTDNESQPGRYRTSEMAGTGTYQTARPAPVTNRNLYERLSVKKALTVCEAAFGYMIGVPCAATAAALMIAAMIRTGWQGDAPAGFASTLICGALGLWAGIAGSGRFALIKSYERYTAALRDRTYIDLTELSAATGRSVARVRKDLRKIMKKGWYHQGHMDDKETCLITSAETYQLYLEAEKRRELTTKQEAIEAEKESKLTPEEKEMIDAGTRYMAEIHECNEEIPGEVISAKIQRLEDSLKEIFDRAKERPEVIGNLRKLMSYYLPTTVKLLRAYADMDKQGIAGENINNAKAEIEATIDTMNDAFVKLFDSLFQSDSWDVSTDATVMKNMLEQEGLAGRTIEETVNGAGKQA